MARRIKPKIKYKKNKKAPKAMAGAAMQAGVAGVQLISGAIQKKRAKAAEAAFDTGRLERGISSATQKMADQPIDQGLIQGMKESQAADRASAMGALSKDPRNALAGVQALNKQAGAQNLELLEKQQTAKTSAMQNLASEQKAREEQRLSVAESELAGIKAEKAAGQQNMMAGLEGIASSAAAMMEEGGSIDEEGGVTPGEFDHDSNPIDMVQDGEKIGEATGGELILPPDDVEDIRDALKSGDKDTAFKLMEDLVAKYDENTIGEDDDSEAKDGGKVKGAVDKKKASEIMKVMNNASQQVRNIGELPFDSDPTNPAGLVNYVSGKLSFDINPEDSAEINFIDKYRKSLVKKEGRTDRPKMQEGGYMSSVKSKLSSLLGKKLKS
tara:strand:+ start:52 stop:1203 length:1152 start_codon:yes stop_codon:yes gene_type:complete